MEIVLLMIFTCYLVKLINLIIFNDLEYDGVDQYYRYSQLHYIVYLLLNLIESKLVEFVSKIAEESNQLK